MATTLRELSPAPHRCGDHADLRKNTNSIVATAFETQMTSKSFTVTFDDSDMHTLQEALTHYLSMCEREIAKGGTTPFIARKGTIEQIRSAA